MMRTVKRLGVLVLAIALSGCTLPWEKRNQGALQVTSNLAAAVDLNDQHAGQTPFFDENLKTGEYSLKLTPSGGDQNNVWQTKVSVGRRVLTVVNYEFGKAADESSYEVLELEPLANKKTQELVLSTLPDNVIVKLDGELKGFSPISFDEISAGDHTIGLEAPGYKTKTINAKVNEGHRLKMTIQLARDSLAAAQAATTSAQAKETSSSPKPSPSASPKASPKTSPSPSPKTSPSPSPSVPGVISGATDPSKLEAPYVKILESGTGWLRVRSSANATEDNEVAKVKVGTYFKFVEKDDAGWSKIEYETGKEGWVASKYTELTE